MSSSKHQTQLVKMDQTNLKAYLGNVSGRIGVETSFTSVSFFPSLPLPQLILISGGQI